jgi:hypothetical protein
MATLQDADLFVVQQGNTVYKVSTDTISKKIRSSIDPATDVPVATDSAVGVVKPGDNLTVTGDGTLNAVIPTGMNIKGMYDPSDDAPTAVAGDLYTMSSNGTLNATWGALNSQAVSTNDAVIYTDSNDWDYLGAIFGGGVVSLSGAAPIVVSGSAETPVVSITPAATDAAGSMSAADKTKLEGIAAGADIGTVTSVDVISGRGLAVTNKDSTPVIELTTATKAVIGSVMFADAAAITNGTTLKAVGADDLKVVADKVATLEAIEQVSVEAGVHTTVSESSGVYTVDVKIAKTTEAGVIEIATGDEIIAGTDTAKAVTSAGVAAHYVPQNFSTLDPLP